MALATSAVPTMADENHNIATLFFSAVPENVTNCDNGKKAVHHSITNLCTVNHDKEHNEMEPKRKDGGGVRPSQSLHHLGPERKI